MAEELNTYINNDLGFKSSYIHSDVTTLDRISILDDLRNGTIDVLVGVNLLREGLDLPQVSLVVIFDADKEGFLRNYRSLTQTAGRAARHVNGKVIMFADKITDSMKRTIDETNRRREKQMRYNREHGITPTQIIKTSNMDDLLELYSEGKQNGNQHDRNKARAIARQESPATKPRPYIEEAFIDPIAADPVVNAMTEEELEHAIKDLNYQMINAAKQTDFILAAGYRDQMLAYTEKLEKLKKNNA